MRRRVLGTLPADEAGRELKLGPGGLRDIEFAVQLLQLVHGRADESLRVPATLPALRALAAGGYVGRADAARLAAPTSSCAPSSTCSSSGSCAAPTRCPRTGRAAPARPGAAPDAARHGTGRTATRPTELIREWRRHAAEARQLHEKLFYRPLLDAVARLPGEAVRLTPDAARSPAGGARLRRPGRGAAAHRGAHRGGGPHAAIQRTLLPALLGWFADAPEPDAGLLGVPPGQRGPRRLALVPAAAAGRQLVAERMARLLASRRYATDLLLRAPEAVAMLGRRPASWRPRHPTAMRAGARPQPAGRRSRPGPVAPSLADPPPRAAPDRGGLTSSAWPNGRGRGALTDGGAVTVAAALEAARAPPSSGASRAAATRSR